MRLRRRLGALAEKPRPGKAGGVGGRGLGVDLRGGGERDFPASVPKVSRAQIGTLSVILNKTPGDTEQV